MTSLLRLQMWQLSLVFHAALKHSQSSTCECCKGWIINNLISACTQQCKVTWTEPVVNHELLKTCWTVGGYLGSPGQGHKMVRNDFIQEMSITNQHWTPYTSITANLNSAYRQTYEQDLN